MKEAKFTEGEWTACGTFVMSETISDTVAIGQAGDAAIKYYSSGLVSEEEQAANANLIAAAPDMYDLLSTVENDDGTIPAWLWDKIQMTLAKARGEL